MAQEFIKELERMKATQAEQGGFNAPAPQESVVDTVGQAPEVQSPFGQQAGLDAISREQHVRPYYANVGYKDGIVGSPKNLQKYVSESTEQHPSFLRPKLRELRRQREGDAILAGTNPLAAPVDLAAAPAVQAPQGQVPMLGGFEVRGAGAERFDLGTPEVPETLFSKEYTDPGGNTASIAGIEAERAKAQIPATQDRLPSTPAVQAETPFFQPTESGRRLASGVSSAKDAIFSAANSVSEAGGNFANSTSGAAADLISQSTGGRVNLQSPTTSGVATKDNAGAPITDESQLRAFMSGLNEQAPVSELIAETPAAITEAAPAVITEAAPAAIPAAIQAPELPQQPLPPVMDGSQIPKAGEEGFKFAERGSPQDYFLSQTNDGTTSLSPEQITRGQEYAKQQGLNFDPTTGFSQNTEAPQVQAPQVQAPQGLTTAGGQPLAEFLAGGQQLDAQGRMINPNVDRSSFDAASASREARQAARPDFGAAVSDRDRRAARGDGISDADRLDIAKANRPGASAKDMARGAKVAAALGIDLKTGKTQDESTVAEDRLAFDKEKYADIQAKEAKGVPLTPSEQLQKDRFDYLKARDEKTDAEETTPEQIEKDRIAEEAAVLDNERKRQIIAKGNEPDATSMQKKRADWEEMKEDMESDNMPEDEIAARRKAFLYGDKFDAFLYGGGTSNKGKGADEVEMTDAKGIRRLVSEKDTEEAIKNGYTLV